MSIFVKTRTLLHLILHLQTLFSFVFSPRQYYYSSPFRLEFETSHSPTTTTFESPSHQISPSTNITPYNPASPISPGIDSTPIHHLPRPTVSTPHNTPLLRKSSRESKLPVHLNDYVCNHIFLTDLTDFYLALPPKPQVCSFGALSPQNQYLINSISGISEPSSYS